MLFISKGWSQILYNCVYRKGDYCDHQEENHVIGVIVVLKCCIETETALMRRGLMCMQSCCSCGYSSNLFGMNVYVFIVRLGIIWELA
jgi:hypothetical protein